MLASSTVFINSAAVFYMTLEGRIQNPIDYLRWSVILTKRFILNIQLGSEYASTLKLQFQHNKICYH